MSDLCEIIDRPAQPVLSIRTRTSIQELPQLIGKAYGEIWQYLGELHEAPTGAPFIAYYNMDMQDLDLEIGFPVSRPLLAKSTIQPGAVPAGKFASYLYTGPYDQLARAYEVLNGWIHQNGYKVTGVAYEVYLNDPASTPPEKLQTQIMFPLST